MNCYHVNLQRIANMSLDHEVVYQCLKCKDFFVVVLTEYKIKAEFVTPPPSDPKEGL